jgi:hypothetical protein
MALQSPIPPEGRKFTQDYTERIGRYRRQMIQIIERGLLTKLVPQAETEIGINPPPYRKTHLDNAWTMDI